ncbi:MAG: integrase [Oceanicoccus sp.]|jgi:integrase
MNTLNVSIYPKAYTWNDLRIYLIAAESTQGRDSKNQQTKNLLSSLNLVLEYQGASLDNSIPADLSKNSKKYESNFLRSLLDKGQKPKTIANQKSQFKKLLSLYAGLNLQLRDSTVLAEVRVALKLKLEELGYTVYSFSNTVAEDLEINGITVYTWISGTHVPRDSAKNRLVFQKIENLLGLPEGLLISIYFKVKHQKAASTAYGDKAKFLDKLSDIYPRTLKFGDACDDILNSWGSYFQFKSDPFYFGFKRDIHRWFLAEPKKLPRVKSPAAMSINGKVSSTALANWSCFSAFWGFLVLPKKPRDIISAEKLKDIDPSEHAAAYQAFTGLGLPKEELRFVDLINMKYLPQYLAYRSAVNTSERSVVIFIKSIKQLLSAKTGFLRQQPDLAPQLGIEPDKWDEYCDQVFEYLIDVQRSAEKKPMLRKPDVPISEILALDNPLVAMLDMETLMLIDRPLLKNLAYATWLRDYLFAKMLRCNPLRINNWAILDLWAVEPGDNKGSIRRTTAGGWTYYIPKEDFKNQKGAKAENYIVDISKSLWPLIDEYIEIRTVINPDVDAKYFFVTADTDSMTPVHPGALARRIRVMSEKYLGYQFGPHAVRHIVATAWLKTHPNAFLTVAHLLHDTLTTVMKNYAHLEVQGAHTTYGAWLDELDDNARGKAV